MTGGVFAVPSMGLLGEEVKMPADWECPMAKIVETEAEMDEPSKVRSAYRKHLIKQAKETKMWKEAAIACCERLIMHRLCNHWEQADFEAVDKVRDCTPNR